MFWSELFSFRYELWKPYLRSAMEGDMRAVSMGTKRKAEVLEACLQQMKACFIDVIWIFLYKAVSDESFFIPLGFEI